MVVRRQAVNVVGEMDERYDPAYSEDQDWCCRMWQAGWRVTYVPQAKALHAHQRAGMRKPWSKMGRAQTVNAVRCFRSLGGACHGRQEQSPLLHQKGAADRDPLLAAHLCIGAVCRSPI